MSSPSKSKGNRFERELVNKAKDMGLNAMRAYGSNGKALGEHEEVDIKIEDLRIQAKRRKKLGQLVKPNENVDIQAIKEDRGDTYIVMKYDMFLDWIVEKKGLKWIIEQHGRLMEENKALN